MYLTGYNGTVRTLEELQAWGQWQNLDPEYQRRALAILDASRADGSPLGIGEIFRSAQQQLTGALARHHQVASGGCCSWNGKRYALNANTAHMAFPGLSYHEATTRLQKALAIDFTGNLAYLKTNGARFGLVEFSVVNKEPWHGQPVEIPHSRARYMLSTMDPLKPFALPGIPPVPPKPVPIKVWAPQPTMKVNATTSPVEDVKDFQFKCNFWGWRDRMGRTLLVDGDYGAKSAEACIAMQTALSLQIDGVYGPKSQAGLQSFLDYMSAVAAGQ